VVSAAAAEGLVAVGVSTTAPGYATPWLGAALGWAQAPARAPHEPPGYRWGDAVDGGAPRAKAQAAAAKPAPAPAPAAPALALHRAIRVVCGSFRRSQAACGCRGLAVRLGCADEVDGLSLRLRCRRRRLRLRLRLRLRRWRRKAPHRVVASVHANVPQVS
jgi:hypothetical protein